MIYSANHLYSKIFYEVAKFLVSVWHTHNLKFQLKMGKRTKQQNHLFEARLIKKQKSNLEGKLETTENKLEKITGEPEGKLETIENEVEKITCELEDKLEATENELKVNQNLLMMNHGWMRP